MHKHYNGIIGRRKHAQPTNGNANINVYNNLSDVVATRRSNSDIVGGNGGNVVNIRLTSLIAAKIRIIIPSGRCMSTSLW